MPTLTPEEINEILSQFFDVVGKRQYIGARYVPVFGRKDETSILWDNTKPYEPLTIVLYQGNSFTSRTYVPIGVDINNTEYWANTGNYNVQVELYRNEVLDFSNSIVEKQFAFATVEQMQESTSLYDGAICHTNGFNEIGDGGASWYVITTTGPKNDRDIIECGSLFAHLIIENDSIYIEQLGLTENNANEVFTRAFEICNYIKFAKNETINISNSIDMLSRKTIDLCNNYLYVRGNAPYVFSIKAGAFSTIKNGHIVGPTNKSMNGINLFESEDAAVRNCTLSNLILSYFNIACYLKRTWIVNIVNLSCDHTNICFELSGACNAINVNGGNHEPEVGTFIHGDNTATCGGLFISGVTAEGLSNIILNFENENSANNIEIHNCYFENRGMLNESSGYIPLYVNKSIHDSIKFDSCVNAYLNKIESVGKVTVVNTDTVLKTSYPTSLKLCKRTNVPYIDSVLTNPIYDKYKTIIDFKNMVLESDTSIYTIEEFPNLFFTFNDASGAFISGQEINFATTPIKGVNVFIRKCNRQLFNNFYDVMFSNVTPQSLGRSGGMRDENGATGTFSTTPAQKWLETELRQQFVVLTGSASGTQGGIPYEAACYYNSVVDAPFYLYALGLDF